MIALRPDQEARLKRVLRDCSELATEFAAAGVMLRIERNFSFDDLDAGVASFRADLTARTVVRQDEAD